MKRPDTQTFAGNDSYASIDDGFYASGGDFFYCIMDRTQEDVDRVKYLTRVILNHENTPEELIEFQDTLKGALNYSDLERIEYNIDFLDRLLDLDPVSMDREFIPRISYFKNLLINVQKVHDKKYRRWSTPEVPEMPLNTYQKWNDIETILWDCFKIYLANIGEDNQTYCGESLYCNANYIL